MAQPIPGADEILAVLDAGSARTRMLVAEIHEGSLRYRGHAEVPTVGMRKGVIADLAPMTDVIRQVCEAAEASSQVVVEECIAGLGGPHVRGINSQGGITLGSRMREITREDVKAAADRARDISMPGDREILHLLPRHFLLDDVPGIHDPVGMVGHQLEVSLHMVTGSASAHQSLVTCANKAGLHVNETVYEGLAAAESCLFPDDRELGCCLIDIGAGSTELIVYFEGAVAYTATVPIGGDHFTNDLAVGLQVPVAEAEYLKCNYGHAVVTAVSQSSEIAWDDDEETGPRRPSIRQRSISEILEPRAREMFEMIRNTLRAGAVLEALGSGCVLVGGGARMPGILEVAESVLRSAARLGGPVPLSRMPAELQAPELRGCGGIDVVCAPHGQTCGPRQKVVCGPD